MRIPRARGPETIPAKNTVSALAQNEYKDRLTKTVGRPEDGQPETKFAVLVESGDVPSHTGNKTSLRYD